MLSPRELAGRWSTESKSLLEGKYKGPRTWQALKQPRPTARRLPTQTHAANAAAGGTRGGTKADNVAYVSSQYPHGSLRETRSMQSRFSEDLASLFFLARKSVRNMESKSIFFFYFHFLNN